MKIALHGKSTSEDALLCIEDVIAELERRSIGFCISRDFRERLSGAGLSIEGIELFDQQDNISDCDFILSLGGDGTMLDTITYTREYEVPIVGINLGRLGFLATTSRDEITTAIEALEAKNFTIGSRSLIHVDSGDGLFAPFNFGLNEFTIVKKETSSMIVVHTYVDGDYLNAYWADGLIVSTPTGSTGYSLSCGGPLVDPKMKNFILTPVSPHNLNVRPIIVSDESVITFRIEGRSSQFMASLDSRSMNIDDKVQITVKRESFEAKLVQFKKNSYFDTLKKKLNWGFDARN